jgi:hypothetical protein
VAASLSVDVLSAILHHTALVRYNGYVQAATILLTCSLGLLHRQ